MIVTPDSLNADVGAAPAYTQLNYDISQDGTFSYSQTSPFWILDRNDVLPALTSE